MNLFKKGRTPAKRWVSAADLVTGQTIYGADGETSEVLAPAEYDRTHAVVRVLVRIVGSEQYIILRPETQVEVSG